MDNAHVKVNTTDYRVVYPIISRYVGIQKVLLHYFYLQCVPKSLKAW